MNEDTIIKFINEIDRVLKEKLRNIYSILYTKYTKYMKNYDSEFSHKNYIIK